jgi:transcriptional regulator with XRE-family HTH domain
VSGPKICLDNRQQGAYSLPEVNGDQMRIIREANGLTQQQLADLLGIDGSYVSLMESGARRINRRTALAFAQVINAHKDRTKGRQRQTA